MNKQNSLDELQKAVEKKHEKRVKRKMPIMKVNGAKVKQLQKIIIKTNKI